MTKKYYVSTTSVGTNVHGIAASNSLVSTLVDPGTGGATTWSVNVAGSAADQLCYALYTPSGEPNSADWPAASPADAYLVQLEVVAAGVDLIYGPASSLGGHGARVNSSLSSDLQTQGGASAAGTGIKSLLVAVNTWNPSAGSTSDRLEALIGCDNSNMMEQTLTINVNTSNTFLQGPWVSPATLEQSAFRARNDDGSLISATWKAAQDTNWSQAVDENFRVRFELEHESGDSYANGDSTWGLQYRQNGGAWTAVTSSTPVQPSLSIDLTDETQGTTAENNLLTTSVLTWLAAIGDETGSLIMPFWPALRQVELEFCLQLDSAQVANGDTIELRVVNLTGSNGETITYTAVPTITVSESGGGTQYDQALTGSLSFAGATPVKQANKALTASQSFTGGLPTRAISRSLTASLSPSGAVLKQAARALSASLGLSGAIASSKTFLRDMTASLGFSGAHSKSSGKALSASLSPSGSVAKQTARALTAALDFATAFIADFISGGTEYTQNLTASLGFGTTLDREARRTVAASPANLGFSTAFATAAAVQKILTATLDFAGSVAKQTGKPLSSGLTFASELPRLTSRSLAGSLSPSGDISSVKTLLRAFTAALDFSGATARQTRRGWAASLSTSATVVKQTTRSASASLDFTGSITRQAARLIGAALDFNTAFESVRILERTFAAVLDFSGAVAKSTQRSLVAGLGFSGDVARSTWRSLTGVVDFSATMTSLKAFFREFTADLGFTTSFTRLSTFGRAFTASLGLGTEFSRDTYRTLFAGPASLSFSGDVSTIKVFLRTIEATLDFAGDISKSTSRALAAVLDFAGALSTTFQGGSNEFFESFSAALGFSGSVNKSTSRAVTGSVGFVGAVTTLKVFVREYLASLSFNAEQSREVGKVVDAALGLDGSITRSTSRQIAAALSLSASVTRSAVRSLGAGLSFTGALSANSIVARMFEATLTFTGSLVSASILARSFSAALSFAGDVRRATTRPITADLAFEGQVSRITAKALVGALTPSGGVSRMTSRSLGATLAFTGAISDILITGGQRVLIAAGRVTVGLSAMASTQIISRAMSAFRVAGKSGTTLNSRSRIGKE